MDENELMNRVYDTLMGNVGMSEHHVPFPVEKIANQFVDNNLIYFEYEGQAYHLVLEPAMKLEDPNA